MYNDDAIMVLPGVGYCIGGEFGYNAKWYNYGVTTGIYLQGPMKLITLRYQE